MSRKKSKKTQKKGAAKKKGQQKPTPKVAPTPKKVIKEAPRTYLIRPETSSPNDGLYQKVFWGLSLGAFLILFLLSLGSGINGDDEYQNDYATKLVSYYTSGGADTSAYFIQKGNMHYYGGFFDLTTGLVNQGLGLDEFDYAYHQVRHFFNILFGLLAMIFVGLLAKEIAGWRAGIIAFVFLFLSPRFLGHSLMNPKDIPFAAGFAIALYYMVRLFRTMPTPNWKTLLGLCLGIALAIATRSGGLLLFAYLFLFAGIDFLMKYGIQGIWTQTKTMFLYLGYGLGVSVVAYFLAVLTWPAALADPLNHPLEALTEFSKLGVRIRLLFRGENIMSDSTVWYYALLWIAKTIPLFVLIGFVASFVFLPQLLKRYHILPILLLYFSVFFPLSYIIVKDSLLHDGWRHLQFVYPGMVLIAALLWERILVLFQENKGIQYAIWAVLGLTIAEAALFIVRNSSYPYVYFNPIGGGMKGAFGNYETDYWGLSVKQAIDWLDDQGIIDEQMQDTVVIGTTFAYPLSRLTYKKYNGKVRTQYIRYNKRYSRDWDYGIFPSRFIRGPHLRAGQWPNSKTIHTIKANGIPLTAIVKDDNHWMHDAEKAIARRQWPQALPLLNQELQQHPDNELAWLSLANTKINLGDNPGAIQAVDEGLKVAPKSENAYYYKGLAQLRSGKTGDALLTFYEALRVNKQYAIAYYYIAIIKKQQGDLDEALRNALLALEYSPRFKPGYELVGQIYQDKGDPDRANAYLQAAQKL